MSRGMAESKLRLFFFLEPVAEDRLAGFFFFLLRGGGLVLFPGWKCKSCEYKRVKE